jgi:hypothetical protein
MADAWTRARCARVAINAFRAVNVDPAKHQVELAVVADMLCRAMTGETDTEIAAACQMALAAEELTHHAARRI